MPPLEQSAGETTVDVRSIGGIDSTTLSLATGVNVLAGRNATNRTSFLRALMGALGSDDVPLKADADEGRIALSIDDEEYIRTLYRQDGAVVMDGDPYLDNAQLADLFAFLLGSNEVRQAVVRDNDLREVLMRPVDTVAIEREIERVRERREEIDRELDEIEELERRLPELEARKRELESEIEEKRDTLSEKRWEIDEFEVELTDEGENPADEKLEELQSVRQDLEDIRFRLDSERESREALLNEREELEERLDELDVPDDRVDEMEAELSRLREEKRSVDSLVNQLGVVNSFNRETLEDDGNVSKVLEEESGGNESVTDALVEDDTVTCWTCGTEVDRDSIDETIGRLDEIRQEQLDRRRQLENRIDELDENRKSHKELQEEYDRLERELERTADEIDEREDTIQELEDRREQLHEEVERLEQRVDELETDTHDELLERHREANELEFELDSLEDELSEVDEEVEEIEERIGEREELRERRKELTASLRDLRTRIERLEREAIEEFNDHMANLLDILEYGNLARIWIERTQKEVRKGNRKLDQSSFDLHIVRETDEETAYQDTIDHLSESEREVVGLVFALAGYLVHDVHEEVPFMLLDSLEAIDSNRIARLIDYFKDYPTYLVVALLPEDAAALNTDYRRITEI